MVQLEGRARVAARAGEGTMVSRLVLAAILVVVGGAVFSAFAVPVRAAEAQEQDLILANEFIAIAVNSGPEAAGRFSTSTTGGDPSRPDDNNKPLTYGKAKPWTSFTTVQVDGQDYVFGGVSKKRAGRGAKYGKLVRAPEIVGEATVETVWAIGDIQVTQRLGFTKGMTTGLADTVRVEYVLSNRGAVPRSVGLRLVLDTMLGSNDGAPFRVHDKVLITDTTYAGSDLPDFWQAFDSLTEPHVMAQGTFTGQEVTVPDRVYFTNWGSLADRLWEFEFRPGRDFTRKGEAELDSAVAMYFDPKPIQPGGRRSVVTNYGLGGVTIAPGKLSVGLTSPAWVVAGESRVFPVVVYVENTGQGPARDVQVTLSLPRGLQLSEGEPVFRSLGEIPSGSTGQAAWRVAVSPGSSGELVYKVEVTSSNSEANRAARTINVIPPARLSVDLQGPSSISGDALMQGAPFSVSARVANSGGTDAYRVSATISPGPGLRLSPGEVPVKHIGELQPQESFVVRWALSSEPLSSGRLEYSVSAASPGLPGASASRTVTAADRRLVFAVSGPRRQGSGPILPGDYFTVDIVALDALELSKARVEIGFDPAVAEVVGGPLGVDRGSFFVEVDASGLKTYLGWTEPVVDSGRGTVLIQGDRGGAGPPQAARGVIGSIRFRAKAPGEMSLAIRSISAGGRDGRAIASSASAGPELRVARPAQSN